MSRSPSSLAATVRKDAHFAQDGSGRLHYYHEENGRYNPQAAKFIHRRVKEIYIERKEGSHWKPSLPSAVVQFIEADAPSLWETPPSDRLNVCNGLLRLDGDTPLLEGHSPDFLSAVQLPVSYDSAATCPFWDEFISSVFPPDAQALAWELIAWAMVPDQSIQRLVVLDGAGSNGKSAFLDAVATFLGADNVASRSLQDLAGNRFAVADIYGKLANIAAEIPGDRIMSTATVKALCGGDWVSAERKCEQGFRFKPFAKLLFSANSLPPANDPTLSWARRIYVIPFRRTFAAEDSGTMRREVLDARLRDPRELSGVLNRALAALPGLRERGDFSMPASVREAIDAYLVEGNPIAEWIQDRGIEIDPTKYLEKRQAINLYTKWARSNKRPMLTDTAFGRTLHRAVPGVQDAQRTIDGRPRTWVYVGFGFPTIKIFNRSSYGVEGRSNAVN